VGLFLGASCVGCFSCGVRLVGCALVFPVGVV